MTQTNLGFPYPDSLDAENNPPADFAALAKAVDAYLAAEKPRRGKVTGSPGANAAVDLNVTFNPAFPSGVLPCVTLGINHAFVDQLQATFVNLSNTGMTIKLYARSVATTGAAVHYSAVRP